MCLNGIAIYLCAPLIQQINDLWITIDTNKYK